MSYNVPEEEKPKFNKNVQSGLNLFAKDVQRTLGQLEVLQPETIVEAYNKPVQAPVTRESMVAPQEQPQVLSSFRNQAEAQFGGDMVSITPEQQASTDLVAAEIDSIRNEAGEIPQSALELFSKPLNANSVRVLGLVDQEGNPTERGQLFYNLQQSGVFNEDGTINEKGQAYLTPIEDIGKEENLKAFQILWDDEVIRPNASFGEIASNTGKFVADAALGGAKRIGQEAQSFLYNSQTWDSALGRTDLRPQELRDKMTASGLGLVEGAVENLAGWAGISDVGSAWIGKKLHDILPAGMEEEAEQALYAARQRQWQTQQDIANLSTGEIAEAILGIDGAVAEAESAKSRIGKEEFDKQYGQTSAFSQLALDPTNAIPASIAVKAARTAPLANRVAITAQKRMAKIAAQDLAIAEAQTAVEAANTVLKKEAATVSVANRLTADISARAGANPELVARANQASQVAGRITESANQIRSTLPTITAELDGLIAKRNSLATRIPEAYSQKVLQTMELGRQMRAMPAKAVGATLERVGDTISKTDNAVTNYLQERGLDQMYTAAVGAAGVMGLAGSPVIGAIGAGAAALKTGKVLSNYGKLFRYVGKEMENVRGQIPFWKRVAAHTAPGSFGRGVAHTFNMLDLGGVTSDTIRRAGRGVAAAAPTDLMFEYLSDGADMRPETLYQAGAESFFIGGSFAGAGGAFMGTKKRMRELSIGDELNFRRDLTDPRQKALFEAIPAGTRRAISTYAIANPTLNYIFKDSGASRYDPNTNTAVINVNSTNPIKALVAHETLHHTVIKNNMEPGISALFLGDTKNNTVGGLFRSRDGKLDPNFEAFRDGYYKRLGVEGMSNAERDAIYPLDKIAVEYFIEKHADQYAAMAESGELGAVAASGAARRKLGSILETVLPRIPVLKDLHFKSGGMIDKNGAWVTGNGILDAEGVKRDPITSKMFRDMNRRSAGLVPGQFDPLMSDKPDSGAPILLNPADGIDAELLHPLVQVDDTNKPIMKDGKPVALDRATELSRALAGLTAKEVLQRKRSENYAPEKGEAYVDDEGQFQPGWLSNDVLTEMFAKNQYNPEQKRIIREMNKLIRKGAGDRVVMINFPATTRNKAGKVVYKPQQATLRDTVPVAVTISKDGNLLFGLMSVTKLHENIQKRSQDRRGKKLYGGNVDLILRDTQAMMDYHKQGVDSIEFFKQKYGAVEADERKKFINTMFGLLNQKEQAVLNPILLEDGVKSRDNVYRTYRADRVSKAVPMSPEEYQAMPFSYEAVSQVRMPEQRQMPEVAVVPERFTGSKEDIDRRGKYVEPPGFFKRFNIDSYERGGRFFDASNGEDLTGKQYATGSIDVSTGKPRLFVDNISDVTKSGAKFKTNLFKQSAGWKWTSENPPSTSTIVSVEGQGKHVYSLKANFESGVELARYSEKKSEPRLRPTAYGELKLGNQVGEISIRGKLHPVYDSIGVTAKAQGSRFMPEGVDEDKFYSQLDRIITDKVPSRATPQQIINSLGEYIVTKTETIDGKDKTTVVGKFPYTDQAKAKSLASSIERGRADWSSPSKVKEEEIKWSGIDQALASLEKDGKVSKEDLLNYLRNEGRVRFEEVTLGAAPSVYQENGRWYVKGQENLGYSNSQEEAQALASRPDVVESTSPTKYAKYQLPGGENYREVVLAMPADFSNSQAKIDAMTNRLVEMQEEGMRYFSKAKTDPEAKAKYDAISKEYIALSKERDMLADSARRGDTGEVYTSSHFPDIPNYVAHMRTNERVDADGRPGLFVEEFQSDRHQEGRKKGYRGDAQLKKFLEDQWESNKDLQIVPKEEYVQKSLEMQGESMRVADAPFRTTWPLQLFKRALRDAVDSGKEWVGWTTGETQNDRFSLEKQLDYITHKPLEGYSEGSKLIVMKPINGGAITIGTDENGRILSGVGNSSAYDGKMLDEVIGKDVAERILAGAGEPPSAIRVKTGLETADERTLKGEDLKVQGTGMKGFYDTMLPKEIGKYVKPFGGKVEKSQIGQSISREDLDMGDMSDATPAELAQLESQGKVEGKAVPIWKVSITPEMRQLAQGQMRFMPEKIDADYMKAVESGDVEAQQRIVDEVAKRAGYKVGPVWHGSNAEFNEFDPKKTDDPNGFWFSTNRDWASRHGIARPYYLKNPKDFGGEDYVIPTSQTNNIKSADPITRDDSGNIIPPSKRFDITSKDLRFMPEGERKASDKNVPKSKSGKKTSRINRARLVEYDEEEPQKPIKKSTAKGNSSAIANAAKLK